MDFSVSQNGKVIVLNLSGKIMGGPDGTLVNDKLNEFLDEGKKFVVVNLKEVRLMNSSGLGMLIGGLTTMRNNGGNLKLACVTKKIKSLMAIAKLNKFFESYETVDKAVSSFDFS